MAAPLDLIGVEPYFTPLNTAYHGSFSTESVESRCGAVVLGLACCFRPFRLTVS